MAVHKKYPALGRGLDVLMRTDEVHTGGSSSINEVSIMAIKANPNQPRREFDETALRELADSIREIGIIQPITVRDMGDGTFTIIAGERRWRASQMAGRTTIPAYIRTVDDENMMEMALVENIQRENLNSMEIALAYQHLIEQYNLTQDRLSERVGKNRSTIANYLRLLKLPAQIQMGLKNHEIDMGHARALLRPGVVSRHRLRRHRRQGGPDRNRHREWRQHSHRRGRGLPIRRGPLLPVPALRRGHHPEERLSEHEHHEPYRLKPR